MRNNSPLTDIVLSSGAIGLLLLAFLFEAVLGLMIPGENAPISAGMPVVFLTPLFELLLMCAVVALIWVMHSHREYGRIVSAVYLIVGLLFLYSNALLAVLPLPDALYVLTIYAAPDTLVFHAAGAAAALGLISLWFWKAPEPASDTTETGAVEG
jgi:hypothetical protein